MTRPKIYIPCNGFGAHLLHFAAMETIFAASKGTALSYCRAYQRNLYAAQGAPFPVITTADCSRKELYEHYDVVRKIRVMQVPPDRHIIAEHLRLMGDFESSSHSRVPAFYGPVPDASKCRIGILCQDPPRYKTWRAGLDCIPVLRDAFGVPVDVVPFPRLFVDLLSWLRSCWFLIATEGYLAHLATAIGVPVVMILGGRAAPGNFDYPLAEYCTNDIPRCAPCYQWHKMRLRCKRVLKKTGFPCHETQTIDSVLAACHRLVERLKIRFERT